MSGIVCPTCNKATVMEAGEDPLGVQYFVCSSCKEAKRWCPRCDQGWVYKWVNPTFSETLFNCEECEATWASIDEIASGNTDHFNKAFDGSMEAFELVKAYEKA